MKYTVILFSLIATCTLTLSGCDSSMIASSAAGAAASSAAADNGISTGRQIDDQLIKSKIDALLLRLPEHAAAKTNISITVYNERVLLLGQVPTQRLKFQIATEVSKVAGVYSVYNQLEVTTKQSVKGYLHDTWLTAAVKGNMVGHVDPLHFKVVTEDGVVYLLGKINKTDAMEAASLAAHTNGVKRVVTLFQINKLTVPKQVQHKDNKINHTQVSNTKKSTTSNSQQRDHAYKHDYKVGGSASD